MKTGFSPTVWAVFRKDRFAVPFRLLSYRVLFPRIITLPTYINSRITALGTIVVGRSKKPVHWRKKTQIRVSYYCFIRFLYSSFHSTCPTCISWRQGPLLPSDVYCVRTYSPFRCTCPSCISWHMPLSVPPIRAVFCEDRASPLSPSCILWGHIASPSPPLSVYAWCRFCCTRMYTLAVDFCI